jgi:signal transduction histidine kinase
MSLVGHVEQVRIGWVAAGRRIAAAPQAPAVAGAVLGLSAVTESITRVAIQGGSLQSALLVLSLISLPTTVPLAFLRPAAAAVTVTVACVLSLALFGTLTVAGAAAQLIVLYRLGSSASKYGDSKHGGAQLLAVVLTAPFLVLALAGLPGYETPETRVLTVLLASLAPAAALAGVAWQARREALVQDAARQVIAGDLLEHTARGERARIARELHDVVAHHISMVAVQAETARLTTPGMPAAGAQRLLAIGDTARAALTEMRRLLGVLREDARAAIPGPPGADRQPQPGLRQLTELLDEARDASGTGTRLILRGSPATLDPGVELAAYRIVQEALTNARRHAPGAAVDVELDYADDALRLRIRDNGPGPPPTPPAGGHGLLGMRERAAAVGGQLSIGPAAGGGFFVVASLPGKGETGG